MEEFAGGGAVIGGGDGVRKSTAVLGVAARMQQIELMAWAICREEMVMI
jgi:hypothetical protein